MALPRLGLATAWRDAARALASNGVRGDDVNWVMADTEAGLFDAPDLPLPPPGMRKVAVPKTFPALAEQVCCSRTPGAHDALYQLLLRLQHTPRLLTNRADPLVRKVEEMAKNIRRDRHKMRAFVRFREVTEPGANRRRFVAWFEPDHRIEELNASFFARRFADMDWAIVTPEVTTTFKDGTLSFNAVASVPPDIRDDTEELWRTYYANIFNPARLKIKAMQAEMPKKYWKNMPEAVLIPDLIAQAEARVRDMRETAPTLAPARARRILDRLPERSLPSGETALQGIEACTRCPLGQMATQAVPGEGPMDARLMIVGEQPGDQEDLHGRPFVGPAGQLFNEIAAQAGLDRSTVYLTNAVKHFKFTPRGKRRIHQRPSASEVHHCRWWLSREVSQVAPQLIMAMGATAALSLTGNGKGLLKRCGKIEETLEGIRVLITLHPSAILRAHDPATAAQYRAVLRRDLALAAAMLRSTDNDSSIH
ncbi:UdgX family uracil-DNA binding protein [Sulfitobacter aestuariivivens]|uniref:UdgX family uracil-DNA binding protein n=1 Tax=Sulfitobacter aestuariivivens TaxID=2766981 RepID=UPI0031B65057